MSEVDVLVVGAGISGLATAHYLSRSGLSVEVWEASQHIGGKIETIRHQGYRLENAASMVMNFRSSMTPFLRSSGLEQLKVQRRHTVNRYVADSGHLVKVPTGFRELLRTSLFSTSGKMRLLAEPFIRRSSAKQHESVADFVNRRLGKEFLDKLFEPYVAGPLASDVSSAEAVSIMPKLVELENRYGSLAVGAMIRRFVCKGRAARPEVISFSGGMETLPAVLARDSGFRVSSSTAVNEIWPVKDGWMTRAAHGYGSRTIFSRHLVLSSPAYEAAALLKEINVQLGQLLEDIDYTPIRVVHTGFRRSDIGHDLNGSGFLLPRNSGFAANGCLWMSSLFENQTPDDRVLMTTYLGGARNPEALEWDESRCADTVMGMLGKLMDIKSPPDMLHIKTHRRGLPLYHGPHAQRLAQIAQALKPFPGLHLVSNFSGGVSVRDRILRAEQAAQGIMRSLGPKHVPSGEIPKRGIVSNQQMTAAASAG